jgi:spore coat protein U-like protein
MSCASRKRLLGGLGVLALAAALPSAEAAAATSTTTFAVTAQVSTTCFIVATRLDFGPYAGLVLSGTSTLTATCSSGTSYRLGLDGGTSGIVTARTMTAGGNTLNYGLFQDAGHTINWGNTPGVDTPAAITGNGNPQPITVFGQLPGNQFPPAGSYSDTITVTLSF